MKLELPAPWRWLLPIVGIFAASRFILLGIADVAAIYLQAKPSVEDWSHLLCRWDCIWYLSVAELGYTEQEIPQDSFPMTNYCFSPLFPLLIRLLGPLFHGNILHAGLVIANACFLAALIYVYRYARLLKYEHNTALLSVALVCFLPQSIAFSALYSESVFLLVLVMAMFHLRRGDYLIAGLSAALLGAARPNGMLIIVFAVALLWHQYGFRSILQPWRAPERWLPLVLAPLGLIAFWIFCFDATGDAFAQSTAARHGWGWHFHPIWENVESMLRVGERVRVRIAAFAGMTTLALSLLLLRERLIAEFAFCATSILLVLSGSGTTGVSAFRYWIVLFPIWVVVARLLEKRPVLAACVMLGIGLLSGMMAVAWGLRNDLAL